MMPIQDEVFHLKGPMGAGLQVEEDGLHIAFVAGTGMLVIMDLVAHLILKNTKIIAED